eukprot:364052-Chlamydomonas_euryale.AAC.6
MSGKCSSLAKRSCRQAKDLPVDRGAADRLRTCPSAEELPGRVWQGCAGWYDRTRQGAWTLARRTSGGSGAPCEAHNRNGHAALGAQTHGSRCLLPIDARISLSTSSLRGRHPLRALTRHSCC